MHLSESLDGGIEEASASGADRHGRPSGEDFHAGSGPAHLSGCLGATDVDELGIRVGPAGAGAVAMDLDRGKATAVFRIAVTVDQDPGRVLFVLLLLRVSEDLQQVVPGNRGARVVD